MKWKNVHNAKQDGREKKSIEEIGGIYEISTNKSRKKVSSDMGARKRRRKIK